MRNSFRFYILSVLAAAAVLATACEKEPAAPDPDKGGGQADMSGLTVDGQFPIVAWTGIDVADMDRKFGPMKECGANVYLGWYSSMDDVMLALDKAEAAGVKLIVKGDALMTDTENTVRMMMDHPALMAYHIEDEPEVSEFSTLSEIVARITAVDNAHPCYINLYPNWAWGDVDGYMSKVLQFYSEIPVRFLSFDHYPVYVKDGVSSLRPYWYKNLEDIRRVARAKNIPFWAFALALSHTIGDETYPIPTLAELRLQMFSNLVYGAQGFQYFTWWGVYQDAPTPVYERVRTVNEELQAMSEFFLGADVAGVWHTGEEIPYGTTALVSMPEGISSLSVSGTGAVVSRIVKDGNTYVAVVNRDYQNAATLEIAFSSGAMKIDKQGYKAEAVSGSQVIGPGDMVLYQIK